MKYTFLQYISALLFTTACFSCSKNTGTGETPASLTIINAVPGSSPLVTNFNGTTPITWYNNATQLFYGQYASSYQYGISEGKQALALYQYPDTIAHSLPLFNLILQVMPGGIQTLFLTGTLTAPDTLLVTEKLPYHPVTDSSLGLRFVNLSSGSSPVRIYVTGQNNNPVVNSLPYKGITGFINFPARAATGNYAIEFRDQQSNVLLGAYTINNPGAITGTNAWRNRNFTFALKGQPGVTSGTTAQGIFLINHK
jgi:hypothetical protein